MKIYVVCRNCRGKLIKPPCIWFTNGFCGEDGMLCDAQMVRGE